jgi:hypothetical protein
VAGWPTIGQVQGALADAGLSASASDASRSLASAIKAWETETGWQPFVASASPLASPIYVPISGTHAALDFGGGVLPGSVTAITLGGEPLTFSGESPDVALSPGDAARKSRPLTYLKLLRRRVCAREGELVVTARWGYCDASSVPADAAAAVLARACLDLAAPRVQERATSGGEECAPLESLDDGQSDRKFATSVTERTAALSRWEGEWEMTVKIYKRTQVV